MWQPLSNLLDRLGRARISYRSHRATLTAGDPAASDSQGSMLWQAYTDPEALHDVWGPVSGSVWEPYHCVPLFASLTSLKRDRIGPTSPELVREIEGNGKLAGEVMRRPLGSGWAAASSLVALDLPGPTSVAAAVRMMGARFQPVCTFDNWPHERGLLKPEIILGQLLRYAAQVAELRADLRPDSPPLLICDRLRLGTRPGSPREFDNRYFLDDSILPSGETLRRTGIRQIICVVPQREDQPRDDLRAYFRDLRREGFEAIFGAAWSDHGMETFSFPDSVFQVKFKQSGFRRSDAGGFGQLIPEPSSSGG